MSGDSLDDFIRRDKAHYCSCSATGKLTLEEGYKDTCIQPSNPRQGISTYSGHLYIRKWWQGRATDRW